MKKKKKLIITLVAVLLVVAIIVAAVELFKKDALGLNFFDRKEVVAKVGDETITASQLATVCLNYINQQQNSGYTYFDVSTEAGREGLKAQALSSLINERAYVAIAKEKGITLTAEEKKACKDAGKAQYQEMIDEYTKSYTSNGTANPKSYAESAVVNYLRNYGFGTKGAFIDYATYLEECETYEKKLHEMLETESGATEEKLPELYADFAKEYADTYADGDVAYADSMMINYDSISEMYKAYGLGTLGNYQKCRAFYIPEDKGFVFVRVIELDDEARADEMAAEIGTDAEKFESFCMSDENKDGLMPKIAADDAYAISATDSSFDVSVYEAAAAMNVGEIKLVKVVSAASEAEAAAEEPAAEEPAPEAEAAAEEAPAEEEPAEEAKPSVKCYIIRRVEGTTGIVPFEKVKDIIGEDLLNDARDEYVHDQIDTWMAAEGKVSQNAEVIAKVKVG